MTGNMCISDECRISSGHNSVNSCLEHFRSVVLMPIVVSRLSYRCRGRRKGCRQNQLAVRPQRKSHLAQPAKSFLEALGHRSLVWELSRLVHMHKNISPVRIRPYQAHGGPIGHISLAPASLSSLMTS